MDPASVTAARRTASPGQRYSPGHCSEQGCTKPRQAATPPPIAPRSTTPERDWQHGGATDHHRPHPGLPRRQPPRRQTHLDWLDYPTAQERQPNGEWIPHRSYDRGQSRINTYHQPQRRCYACDDDPGQPRLTEDSPADDRARRGFS